MFTDAALRPTRSYILEEIHQKISVTYWQRCGKRKENC